MRRVRRSFDQRLCLAGTQTPPVLAKEIRQPDLSLKQYRHDEELVRDELLRSRDLGSFAIKNVWPVATTDG
ncbi:MAG: hypothetical protein WBY44_11305 [Bryobacteraceae bacterium]